MPRTATRSAGRAVRSSRRSGQACRSSPAAESGLLSQVEDLVNHLAGAIWSVKVENLVQPAEPLVGSLLAEVGEEGRHLRLPAVVDAGAGHLLLRGGIVLGLQVADEQPVIGQE